MLFTSLIISWKSKYEGIGIPPYKPSKYLLFRLWFFWIRPNSWILNMSFSPSALELITYRYLGFNELNNSVLCVVNISWPFDVSNRLLMMWLNKESCMPVSLLYVFRMCFSLEWGPVTIVIISFEFEYSCIVYVSL